MNRLAARALTVATLAPALLAGSLATASSAHAAGSTPRCNWGQGYASNGQKVWMPNYNGHLTQPCWISYGSRGYPVKALQIQLNKAASVGGYGRVAADGSFGAGTRNSLAKYQAWWNKHQAGGMYGWNKVAVNGVFTSHSHLIIRFAGSRPLG